MDTEIKQRIEFLCRVDALKGVDRKTRPTNMQRFENSAEHSWHVVLAAMVLAPNSNAPVNLLRVLKMLAIHDIPEIETGDHFHYAKGDQAGLVEQEDEAAKKLFGLLPPGDRDDLLEIFREFQARESNDAKFAHAVDRVAAFLLNSKQGGGTWKEHGVTLEMIQKHNGHMAEGSQELWRAAQELYVEAMK